MKESYLCFYIDGREAKLLRHDADDVLNQIGKRIHAGKPVHEAIHEVAVDTTQAFALDRGKRKQFLRDNEEEIKAAGGDETEAWNAFVAGKTDELTSALEPAVVEDLIEFVSGEEPDGDEDDDDDDEEDDAEDDADEEPKP